MTIATQTSSDAVILEPNIIAMTKENSHRLARLYRNVPNTRELFYNIAFRYQMAGAGAGIVFVPSAIITIAAHAYILGGVFTGVIGAAFAGVSFYFKKNQVKNEAKSYQAQLVWNKAYADTKQAVEKWLESKYGVTAAPGEFDNGKLDYLVHSRASRDFPGRSLPEYSYGAMPFVGANGKNYAIVLGNDGMFFLKMDMPYSYKAHNSAEKQWKSEWFDAPTWKIERAALAAFDVVAKAKGRPQAKKTKMVKSKNTFKAIDSDQPFGRKNMPAYNKVAKQLNVLRSLDLSVESQHVMDRAVTDLKNIKKLRDDTLTLNSKASDPEQVPAILLALHKELKLVIEAEENTVKRQLAIEQTYVLSRD